MQQSETFTPHSTADGSFTLFSSTFGEAFHNLQGARQEAELQFVQPAILPNMVHQPQFRLLDIGYGLGYNTAAALEWIWSIHPYCRVEVIALELDATVLQATVAHNLLNIWNQPIQQALEKLAVALKVHHQYLEVELLLGDARQTIQQLPDYYFDAIFLHPFSPPHCPQLWTIEFIAQVARCLKPTGRLTTNSGAAAVRTALMAANLLIGAIPSIGRRAPGTVASLNNLVLPSLSAQEQLFLKTQAAVPYTDFTLSDPAITILQRRQYEQNNFVLKIHENSL